MLIKDNILLLPAHNFKFVKIDLPCDIDDRAREYQINEYLSEEILNYDAYDYTQKELILHSDDTVEKILIVLFPNEYIFDIEINKLRGIYSIFEIFFFDKTDEINYMEEWDNEYYIFNFKNGKLIDFHNLTNTRIDNNKYITQNDIDINTYKIKYLRKYDFMPPEYIKNRDLQRIKKLGGIIFIVTIAVCCAFYLYIQNKIDNQNMAITNLQSEIHSLKSQIADKRELLIPKKSNDKKEVFFSSINLAHFLDFVFKGDISLTQIEYTPSVFFMVGSAPKLSQIIDFEKYLSQKSYSVKQDFIKYENNLYNFKIEIKLGDNDER